VAHAYDCCRDVDNPAVCENCGYANCVEVAQILALRPSALFQVLKITGDHALGEWSSQR
jgi:hypothetical protein